MSRQDLSRPRQEMVDRLARAHPDADRRVLDAMSEIPRHIFTEPGFWHMAYSDCSLPIGRGQTLSQPATVLRALTAVSPGIDDVLLEIGSGSGYLAAVASRLCRKVYGIERILALVHSSRKVLGSLSIHNVQIGYGDGIHGWPDRAPFDSVLFSAFTRSFPAEILDQVAPGGRMAAPVEDGGGQEFRLWRMEESGLKPLGTLFPCSFVPLVKGGGRVHG